MFNIQKSTCLLKFSGQSIDCFCLCNKFSTTTLSLARPGLTMKKLMGNTKKKQKKYFDAALLPPPNSFVRQTEESKHPVDPKRAFVLNKIFMRYITDLMVSGEKASEFLGHGIEISKVKVTPNFKGLNIYWVAKGNDKDCVVEAILTKNSGYLRHELSTLRVMGEIPKLTFVKDTRYADIMEIDRRLAKADFGDDHIPIDTSDQLKSKLELQVPLDPKTKIQIRKLDETYIQVEEEEPAEEEPLPPMPQNVFGLNHSDILLRIKKTMKKTKAVHRTLENEELPKTMNANPITYTSNKEQREAFKEFLRKREILRSKTKKRDREQNLNEYLDVVTVYEDDSNGRFLEDDDYLSEDER